MAERAWLWVQDEAARRLAGRPYRPGCRPAAPPPDPCRRGEPEDALFALEEGLRCRDLAFVIGEIAGNPRALDLTASRRLSLAAEKHGVPLWLVRLDAAARSRLGADALGGALRAFAAATLEPRGARHARVARRAVPRPQPIPPGRWISAR